MACRPNPHSTHRKAYRGSICRSEKVRTMGKMSKNSMTAAFHGFFQRKKKALRIRCGSVSLKAVITGIRYRYSATAAIPMT